MHFVLTVVTKPGQALDELMEPFSENAMGDLDPRYLEFEVDEAKEDDGTYFYEEVNAQGQHGYWTNPNSRWDWWVVGGRWSDRLLRKDGTRCDTGRVADLDITGTHREARVRAAARLRTYEAAVAEHGPVPSMAWADGQTYDREVIAAFWAHPTLLALKEPVPTTSWRNGKEETGAVLWQTWDLEDLLWVAKSPSGWVEGQATAAIVGHDLLTHDGAWMGKHDDWRLNSRADRVNAAIGFYEAAGAYLANLDGDMVVTSIDYHS